MKNILVLAEVQSGEIKKSTFEVLTFGRQMAEQIGGQCIALVLGSAAGIDQLGQYGAHQIMHDGQDGYANFDDRAYSAAIAQVAKDIQADVLVLPHSANGRTLAGRLAIKLDAGVVTGVNRVAKVDGDALVVDRAVFSGKAQMTSRIDSDVKVVTLMGNSVPVQSDYGHADVTSINLPTPESTVQVVERKTVSGTVPLPEAELVVSAGRGMKGPENWGIIEELAEALGATTACSRPVADSDWRPHHEHVGQTGVAIRPNLYIAIGISGAIQHLAGVNNSRTIVVINKDPEAPFFKAADYGVCADLFDVVPRLTEAIKRHRQS